MLDRVAGKECCYRQFVSELFFNASGQTDCEKRVAAELEEAVSDADGFDTQQLFPDLRELRLNRGARRDKSAGSSQPAFFW